MRKGIILAEEVLTNIVLDVDGWLDAPHPVIDAFKAGVAGKIVVDASSAGVIPAQVAQLLLSAAKSTAEHSGSFEIVHPSDAVKDSLGSLGLAELL